MLMKSFQFIEKVFDEWKPLSSQYVCSCGFQILEMENDAGAILNTAMIYVIIKICSNKAFRHAEPAIRFTIALNAMKKSCRAIFGDIFQRNLTQTFEVWKVRKKLYSIRSKSCQIKKPVILNIHHIISPFCEFEIQYFSQALFCELQKRPQLNSITKPNIHFLKKILLMSNHLDELCFFINRTKVVIFENPSERINEIW